MKKKSSYTQFWCVHVSVYTEVLGPCQQDHLWMQSLGAKRKSEILSFFPPFKPSLADVMNNKSIFVLTSFSPGQQQIVHRLTGGWWLYCTCSGAWLNPQMLWLRPHYPQNGAPHSPQLTLFLTLAGSRAIISLSGAQTWYRGGRSQQKDRGAFE